MAGDPPSESEGMSQEDIDTALAGAGGDAAEDSAEQAAAQPTSDAEQAGQPAQGAGGGGASSQANIDAALAGETGGKETPAPAEQVAEADSGSGPTSQEDIDALFGGGAETETAAADAAAPLPVTNEDGSPKLDSQGRPSDEAAAIAEERAAAEAAAGAAPSPEPESAEMPPPPAGTVSLDLPEFGGPASDANAHGITLLNDVKLDVKIELGRSMMLIEDVLKLGEGSVVELDKLAGDPVDVFVNERLVARGEVLVLNDNFCVRISDILPGAEPAAAAS